MSKPVYLNEQRNLSASGDTNALFRDYLEARSPLRKTSWQGKRATKDLTLGFLPPEVLGALSDPWASPLRPRREAALSRLLADLANGIDDKSFDAVLVGRPRLGGVHPLFFEGRFEEGLSTTGFHEWLEHALGKVGIRAGSFFSVETTCATGTTMLSQARQRVSGGLWRRALLLSFDPVSPHSISLLESLSVVSPTGNPRVFHAARDGFVRSEAFCAAVVSDRHELGDRAPVRVSRVSLSNDSSALTAIESGADLLQRCIEECVEGVDPRGAFVKVHGSGTRMNDLAENTALHGAASGSWAGVPAVAFKSQFGHTLNSSGLFELFLASECLRSDRLNPVLNSVPQDPAIGLNVVHEELSGTGLRACLGLTLGFGGINSAYLLEKGPA